MSDFETVRRWLPEGARTAAKEAYEALDRIQAEAERLQGRIDKLLASPRRCDDCPGGDDYKTEVERLRGYRGRGPEWDRLRRIEEAARVAEHAVRIRAERINEALGYEFVGEYFNALLDALEEKP